MNPSLSETEIIDRLCAISAEQNDIIRQQAHIIAQLHGVNPLEPDIRRVTLECQELTGNIREE